MTRDEKRAWLSRYRERLCRAALIESEAQEARGRALVASPALDGMPRGGGGGSAVERAIVRAADCEREWQDVLSEASRIREEISRVISTLSETEYAVLRLRYLDTRAPWRVRTWREIADAVYLSEDRVKHLHGEALDHVKIPAHDEILHG